MESGWPPGHTYVTSPSRYPPLPFFHKDRPKKNWYGGPGVLVVSVWIGCVLSFAAIMFCIFAPDYISIQIQPPMTTLLLRTFDFTFSLWSVHGHSLAYLPNVRFMDPKWQRKISSLINDATRGTSLRTFATYVCSLESFFFNLVGFGCSVAVTLLALSRTLAALLIATAGATFLALWMIILFWFKRRTIRVRQVILILLMISPVLTLLGALPYFIGIFSGITGSPRDAHGVTDLAFWVQPGVQLIYGVGSIAILATFFWELMLAILAYYMIEPSICYDYQEDDATEEANYLIGLPG